MINITKWFEVIKQIAREFSEDPKSGGPFDLGEMINGFLGDAAAEDFFDRNDTGLNELQIESGKKLTILIRDFAKTINTRIHTGEFIDDPRLVPIRAAAIQFLSLVDR